MMQGVLARGTARAIAGLSPYVAGKTGTSDEENDAWFVGFTNDVTVAVWIGYDNADGKRRTLGGGATGGGVAVPIFEPVIQAVWANVAPKTALAPPSPEAKRQLACKSIDLESGEGPSGGRRAITECFRIDRNGQIIDTQYQLVSREEAYGERDRKAITAWRPILLATTAPIHARHLIIITAIVAALRDKAGAITTTTTGGTCRCRRNGAISGTILRPDCSDGRDPRIGPPRSAIPMGANTRRRSGSIPATSGATGDTDERCHDAEPASSPPWSWGWRHSP